MRKNGAWTVRGKSALCRHEYGDYKCEAGSTLKGFLFVKIMLLLGESIAYRRYYASLRGPPSPQPKASAAHPYLRMGPRYAVNPQSRINGASAPPQRTPLWKQEGEIEG